MSSLDRVPELKDDPEFVHDKASLWSDVSKYITKTREIDEIAARDLLNSLVTVSDRLNYLDTREAVTEALLPVQREILKILETVSPLEKLFKFAANMHFEGWWK